jgi:uncharacterized membrane protein YgcG
MDSDIIYRRIKYISIAVIGTLPLVANAYLPDLPTANKIFDESGTLTKSSINYIEKTFQKLKSLSGIDIYYVSIKSLPYETTAEQYAEEIYKKWNLSGKDIVVVLVNKIARAGIYFENDIPTLPKSTVTSITEETYPFKAKESQYSSAAIDVANRLTSILSDKGDPGAPSLNQASNSSNFKSAKATEEKRSKYVAIIIILLVIAFVIPMVQFFWYVKEDE